MTVCGDSPGKFVPIHLNINMFTSDTQWDGHLLAKTGNQKLVPVSAVTEALPTKVQCWLCQEQCCHSVLQDVVCFLLEGLEIHVRRNLLFILFRISTQWALSPFCQLFYELLNVLRIAQEWHNVFLLLLQKECNGNFLCKISSNIEIKS